MYKQLIIIAFLFGVSLNLSGQLLYTRHFTKMLDKGMLLFNKPVEGWFKPIPLIQDEFFKYDLVLQHTDDDLEMRCIIEPTHKSKVKNNYPHLLAMKNALSAASNNEANEMVIQKLSAASLDSLYNADWGLMVDFIPKKTLTNKSYGKLLSLFAEDKSRLFVFFFYNEAEKDQLEHRLALFQYE
jgi:hypothetical protein